MNNKELASKLVMIAKELSSNDKDSKMAKELVKELEAIEKRLKNAIAEVKDIASGKESRMYNLSDYI